MKSDFTESDFTASDFTKYGQKKPGGRRAFIICLLFFMLYATVSSFGSQ